MKCTKCDPQNRPCEKGSLSCSFIRVSDEKIRILVTGLWMLGIETSASDQGGEGHCKPYPWVELAFDKENDMLRKARNVLRAYHLSLPDIRWTIEVQLGGIFWIVPEIKELPLSELHKSAEKLGWFLHDVRPPQ